MAVRPVLQYPHPVLRESCRDVTPDMIVNGCLQVLVTDLMDTMYATPGTVGLAAPQIGETWRVFVMDVTANTTRDQALVVVNPVIETQSKWKFGREGCLSFPEYLITLKRARKIQCRYLDGLGQHQVQDFQDFAAVVFQHEYDHLAGILFIDLARSLETDLLRRDV
jgi:peptide deformylase